MLQLILIPERPQLLLGKNYRFRLNNEKIDGLPDMASMVNLSVHDILIYSDNNESIYYLIVKIEDGYIVHLSRMATVELL